MKFGRPLVLDSTISDELLDQHLAGPDGQLLLRPRLPVNDREFQATGLLPPPRKAWST